MNRRQVRQSTGRKAKKESKPYEVILFYSQDSRVCQIISASSLAQATRKADEIEAEDLTDDDLDPVNGELWVDSVKPLKEGESHE